MKLFIITMILLLPSLSYARTDCRAVEHPDHLEAECLGDEKAVPAPEVNSVAPNQLGSFESQDMPEYPRLPADTTQYGASQMQSQRTSVAIPEAPQRSATSSLKTPNSSSSMEYQGTVVHRQGRQQYQQAIEDAIAARRKLIADQQ